jgi:hypothetical protein
MVILAVCLLCHADERRLQNAFISCFVVTLITRPEGLKR